MYTKKPEEIKHLSKCLNPQATGQKWCRAEEEQAMLLPAAITGKMLHSGEVSILGCWDKFSGKAILLAVLI